jgi:hypothetical protein
MSETRAGAYGLSFGPPVEPSYLVAAPEHWPQWHLEWRLHRPDAWPPERIGDERALVNLLPRGQVLVDRATATSTLLLPEPPSPHAWVHPYLSSTAVVAARWAGRQSFHAGCFVLDGCAWGVIGERNAGKSSALAWMASHGLAVVCDDILVLDRDRALAGPRCLDLRQSAAEHFGLGTYIGQVGSRERWRAPLPPVSPSYPFKGWVAPNWGNEVAFAGLSATVRMALLLEHRGLLTPEPNDPAWLSLLAKPMVKLVRPRDWGRADEAMRCLLDELRSL